MLSNEYKIVAKITPTTAAVMRVSDHQACFAVIEGDKVESIEIAGPESACFDEDGVGWKVLRGQWVCPSRL